MTITRTFEILVADDDPIFTETAAACLNGHGRRVTVVSDGADAIFQLETRSFDLALVDLTMPKIDGLRMIAIIRSTPKLKDLPIIVVTSRQDQNALQEATRLGAEAYFAKPVNWIDLRNRVRQKMLDFEATPLTAGA